MKPGGERRSRARGERINMAGHVRADTPEGDAARCAAVLSPQRAVIGFVGAP
jgi:hypothetical protein